MNWETFLTSTFIASVIASLIGILSNIIITGLQNKNKIKAYKYSELHRILKETEQVHGFWRCEKVEDYLERMYFFWGNLEICKPLFDRDLRDKVDNIIRSLNEELNVMNETQIVPTSLSGNLNKMVVVLKECIQEQIIRLV